ncbi:hypothetical protein MBM09_05700 [Flaviramulus sp. BrNp1-15]|uniref:DUF6794 domain-containing protein n=1 Tax=Flaviramulus sp. BrNp1-15 TaxID=2916754 RepID=UPI001EE93F69|nr:DUF6794 domain-containing protein [Flaviramulus sp. BrNp1-15]ULC60481.1 hypothetical protein MBM09_05700 [Flaviramulus sp. BrNp1-15]
MRKLILILTIFSLLSCNRKEEIPKELEYSFEYLNEVWSPEDIEVFKNIKKNDTTPNNLHFGIGLHLRNNLLRHHSKSDTIVAYFNSLGITHYDYMSGLILYSYHQHLNNENIDIQDKVNEIIISEKPYVECVKEQKIIGLEKYNKFEVNDTINVKMPVSKNNSVVYYGCPNLDWEFRKSFDLSIDGVITDKFYEKDSLGAYFKVKILTKNHPKTEIFMNEVNVGDKFEVSLIDSAWKIKTTGNNVYN